MSVRNLLAVRRFFYAIVLGAILGLAMETLYEVKNLRRAIETGIRQALVGLKEGEVKR